MTGSKHGVQCSDVNLWRRKNRAGVLKSGSQSLKTGKLYFYMEHIKSLNFYLLLISF